MSCQCFDFFSGVIKIPIVGFHHFSILTAIFIFEYLKATASFCSQKKYVFILYFQNLGELSNRFPTFWLISIFSLFASEEWVVFLFLTLLCFTTSFISASTSFLFQPNNMLVWFQDQEVNWRGSIRAFKIIDNCAWHAHRRQGIFLVYASTSQVRSLVYLSPSFEPLPSYLTGKENPYLSLWSYG